MTTPALWLRGAAASAVLLALCCGSADSPTAPAANSASAAGGELPAIFSRFPGAQASRDGSQVVLRATSVPDHPSPYFGIGHPQYEAPQPGMLVNPNRIVSQSLVLRVPVSPQPAAPSDTPLGPMGVAVNGVALFNQYAAGRSPLADEIRSFDRYNGHPQQSGTYHYHLEPLFLTAQGNSRVIGVLLDGFFVYGTRDADGSVPTGLDACNGHTGPTADNSQGVYHYHITAQPPYIAGCFRGTPGSVTGG
jgi:hypothetical protein